MEEGNYLGAVYQLERTIQDHPDFIDGYHKLALACIEAARVDKQYLERAREVYETIETLVPEDDLELIKGVARLNILEWKADEALARYEEVLAKNPENCEFWKLYGDGHVAKAVELSDTEDADAEAFQFEEARASYERAIQLCPENFDSYEGLAIILNQRKLYQDVVRIYGDLREKYPENVQVHRAWTMAQFRFRDWERAARGFGELMDVDPRPKERLSYASVLRKLERFDDADEQLRIYQETAPKQEGPRELTALDILREELGIQASAEKASALIDEGNYDEALVVWREARARVDLRAVDPKFRDAAGELIVWLERRIQHAENLKQKNP
jgi:tetratricopeptide (TPR) repeat protein